LYEDDGMSMNHTTQNSYARTTAELHTSGANVTILVQTTLPAVPFAGMLTQRDYTFQFLQETQAPQLATCNDAEASAVRIVQGLAVSPGAGPDVQALEITCSGVIVSSLLRVVVVKS
jgi:hypothetical protein